MLTLSNPVTTSSPSIANGNGLLAEYFSGKSFTNRVLSRTDETVNFRWGKGAPSSQVGADNFSVRWSGRVAPKYSETYTFYTQADDGVRLWVNGNLLIDNWKDHAVQENRGTLQLQAGQKYDIKLEYYENKGKATSKLLWSSPSQSKQIIPKSQLFSGTDSAPIPPVSIPPAPIPPVPIPPTPIPSVPIPANQKPVLTVPGAQAVPQGLRLSIGGIRVQDPDAGNGNLTVNLTATQGTLTVNEQVNGGVGLVNIKNNGTSSVVLIGTLLQLNATLLNSTGLSYNPSSGFQGTDQISLMVNDNGNTGSGSALIDSRSISITVSAALNPTTPHPNDRSPLGINLNGVTDFTTQWPFVDVFNVSRSWIPQGEGRPFGQGDPLNLTPEGWVASLKPGQTAETVMLNNGAHYPGGQYTLLYEGKGALEFGLNSAQIVSQTPGRMVLNIKPQDAGIWMRITQTDPSDPIRNFHLIMPGFENTYKEQPFHPLFLERISQFSTLRFMDWQGTNNSTIKEWSQRPTLQSATQTNSVALEYMINLSNRVHADPWFAMPHQASDDYVRQFATMVRDRLDPSLKVHIEYSNEVWNGQFQQAGYARDKGRALGLSDNDFQAQLRYYSQRSQEVFKIWEEVFGGTNRLVRVLSAQGANSWTADQVVSWNNAYQHADSVAIAPYFYGGTANDPAKVNETLGLSQNQLIDMMLSEIRTTVQKMVADNSKVASQYGLKLESYEGGPHLYSYQMGDKEQQVTQLFNDVSRNPRMRDVYKEYLNIWKQNGGGLFSQFVDVSQFTKYGQWGALEYQDQDISTAPKYLGLVDFIQANPTAQAR